MADINHVISLGIGSPAAIQEFLTFGLQQSTLPPVTVPDVVGLDEASAIASIEAEGLVASSNDAYNGSVAIGDVISQSPSAGSSVASGSTVTIYVSVGPAPEGDDMRRWVIQRKIYIMRK